ncbi:hypothetical protein BDR04DRAFT_1228368 [Suillus decipiens]|nr:hypothetical protein BDR04DRAFT_1228368 [Suillus decipiens]
MAYGEVTLKQSLQPKKATTITGCVNYGIGRTLPSDADTAHRTRFQSLILVVEGPDQAALHQLLAYLASIHHSRQVHKRSDTSVYGVTSDGLLWRFVTITHSGSIKISNQFSSSTCDGTKLILECLTVVLETAALMSPNTTPEKSEHMVEVVQGDPDDTSMCIDMSHKDYELPSDRAE